MAKSVENKELRKKLKPMRKSLKVAETAWQLNDVRSVLVKEFSGYAGGKAFFGKKLMPITASSGTYKVVITYGDVQAESNITLRDDPLSK